MVQNLQDINPGKKVNQGSIVLKNTFEANCFSKQVTKLKSMEKFSVLIQNLARILQILNS